LASITARSCAEIASSRGASSRDADGVVEVAGTHPHPTTHAASIAKTVLIAESYSARAPTSHLLALVESGQRLTHQLRVVDENTPTRRRRPAGVQRAEVFVALTEPDQPAPADPSEYRYIGSVTRGETTLCFESSKGGMQAHYLSRWVSTSGATGPWSETASATVAA
jgi:hypothetical protein